MKKLLLVFVFVFLSPAFATGIGSGINAACDNATLSKYTGTVNAEIDWEPNTINLSWYDGATKLNVDTNAQTCTYDGTITVPPQPTKLGYTFNGWKVVKVPEGYTALEYIESTGTQYIDTGIHNWNNTIEYDVKLSIQDQSNTPSSNGIHSYFGCWSVWNSSGRTIPTIGTYSNYNARNNFIAGTQATQNIGISNGQTGTISLHGNTISWSEGSTTAFNRGDPFVVNLPIVLFANYLGDYVGEQSAFKLYSAKFWLNGNLVFDGVPARRNSDGVLGLYDSVSNTFKTNSGTGTFVAGPVVQ